MKKIFFLLALPLLAMTFNACGGGGDDDGQLLNTLTIGSKTYDLSGGRQVYSSELSTDSYQVIALQFIADDDEISNIISLYLYAPAGSTSLFAGTYKYTSSSVPWAWVLYPYVYLYDGDQESTLTLTAGTVKVKMSGSTYYIDMDAKRTGGSAIKGNYTGTLPRLDISPVE